MDAVFLTKIREQHHGVTSNPCACFAAVIAAPAVDKQRENLLNPGQLAETPVSQRAAK